jgi:hypothetical protein
VTRFSTLNPDGTETNVREIKQSDLQKCRFCIFMPEHYRDDGSCKCDDAEHREFMIREWEYKRKDFKGIPLRRKP